MSLNPPAAVPPLGDEPADVDGVPPEATKEVDGREILDPDADPDKIDSADADHLAAGDDGAA